MTRNEAIEKVVNYCDSQVGYPEGADNWNKYAEDPRLQKLYGWRAQYQPWCDIFTDAVFIECFGLEAGAAMTYQPIGGGSAACRTSAGFFKNNGAWFTKPEVGDVIFFYYSGDINHQGIVVATDGDIVNTVEGNSSDKVSKRSYRMGDSSIAGFGRPKYELVADTEAAKTTTPAAVQNRSAKYSDSNRPVVCMMTQSTCYRGTSRMDVKGVLWHSTGANNPWLKRYVQPDDTAVDKSALLTLIGVNQYHNDWNHTEVQAGLNAWVGKLANGTVASVQTMPWDYKPWGCGGGCNNGWIQFEICEDSLGDPAYFNAVYEEACQLTAYLCKMYGINPKGTVSYNGKNVPTILCHQDSYRLGLGSNHSDVYHWFSRFGKTMDDVRNDVAKIAGSIQSTPSPSVYRPSSILRKGSEGPDVKAIQEKLIKLGYNLGKYGADGEFGNDTYDAVVKFQRDHGLEIDGIVGDMTRAAIDAEINKRSASSSARPANSPSLELKFAAGSTVMFTGSVNYVSATGDRGSACRPGKVKITKVFTGKSVKHPYHVVKVLGGGSTAFGWVDEKDIRDV